MQLNYINTPTVLTNKTKEETMKRYTALLLSMMCTCLSAYCQQTETKYLSGTDADHTVQWNFRCSKGMNSGRWKKINVPSCWEMQGFGEYTYGRYYKKKDGRASDETGHYRHTFTVPRNWKGRKVDIVFEGVMTDACVTVNGHEAGAEHQGGFTAFSYDISHLLRYGGRNTLEVIVEKQSKDRSVNAAERRADWWLFGGIYRPVWLKATPQTHIAHAGIDARGDGTLSMRLTIPQLGEGYRLQTTVEGAGTQTSELKALETQTVVTEWKGVRQWNPEQPNMYTVRMRLLAPDGSTVHETQERIGFRTMDFRPHDGFYINGTRIIIKGVNRHCCYPETGRTTSRRMDLEDLKLIKGMNANAIRSHYPPDSHLLDLCDSLGILYFNELPGWQNSYSTAAGSRIVREMVTHDANHPCIFVWGNGNEGGFNNALDTLFTHYDPQRRHVVHAWAMANDVDTHHYPAYQTGVGRLANGHDVFMPTEFLHAQYDKGAGASLDDYWANYKRNPLFSGGFIWAWADEGIVRTDLNGIIDTDGPNAPDGIVGPHREKEGSWYTVRDVWSPIQIAPLAITTSFNGSFLVSNDYLFTSLKDYTMAYKVQTVAAPLYGGQSETLAEGTVTLPQIGPGEAGRARMQLPDDFSKGDILWLTALNANGDTINQWSFPMNRAATYHAAKHCHTATAATQASGHDDVLEGGGVAARFDMTTGMLAEVSREEKRMPLDGGPMPVGMKMTLKSIAHRQDGKDALLVAHYTGAVDSIVWRMTPQGTLGMDILMLNRRDGGGFKGDFITSPVGNIGFSFNYPEEQIKGVRWLGRGPYRVWRNRYRGQCYGLWQKDYNNTITGESTGRLVYPEFKGYHGDTRWATLLSDNADVSIMSETDGLYLRLFTPEEPHQRRKGEDTMQPFPDGDISFLLDIPAMRSYKPIEQLGPQAQPANVRINKGDDGLRLKLWFSFK